MHGPGSTGEFGVWVLLRYNGEKAEVEGVGCQGARYPPINLFHDLSTHRILCALGMLQPSWQRKTEESWNIEKYTD